MPNIQGIAASTGIAIAKVYHLATPDLSFEKVTTDNPNRELERSDHALATSKHELEKIKAHIKKELDEKHAEIFSAHLLVLDDPEFIQPIKEKIRAENTLAETALEETTDHFINLFKNMENGYMRERVADIQDVSKRVLTHLLGLTFPNPALIDEEVIIIANDLTPSDTAQLNRQFVKGFATDVGGRTSHSAIMARSLEIPAVVGTNEITAKVKNDDTIIIDGMQGIVITRPTADELKSYR